MDSRRRLRRLLWGAEQDVSDRSFSLDGLTESDRRIADQWIREVGLYTFLRIAAAATKKGRGRTRIAADYLVIEAAALVVLGRKSDRAAGIVARRVVDENDWRSQRPIEPKSLKNRIHRELARRLPRMRSQLSEERREDIMVAAVAAGLQSSRRDFSSLKRFTRADVDAHTAQEAIVRELLSKLRGDGLFAPKMTEMKCNTGA